METTLIILKPDAVQRGLMGRIISRFEDKGLKIVAAKMMTIDRRLAERHYAVHKGKPFYNGLIQFMTSAPVLALAIRGERAIEVCRKMMGATFSSKAEPGSIRGDFGIVDSFNLVHGSDGTDTAAAELELFFEAKQIRDYERAIEPWVRAD